MQSAVRKIHFCYGHRVMNHESKCATLHGHNGVLWVHAQPIAGLDSVGRVIDFSIIKSVIGGWVLENWDHTMIISKHLSCGEQVTFINEYRDVIIDLLGDEHLDDTLKSVRGRSAGE